MELKTGNHVRVQTKKVKFTALPLLPQVKIKSAISRRSRAGTAKNLTKKRACRTVVLLIKSTPVAIVARSYGPNSSQVQAV